MTRHSFAIIVVGFCIFSAISGLMFFNFPVEKEILPASINIPVKKDNTVNIFFAGDVMLDRGIQYFADRYGGNDYIFYKISNFLKSNDLNVVNLEGPITDNPSVSYNSKVESYENYIFTFDPSWAETLAKNKINVVDIGNNHILNFGKEGVEETKKYLEEAGIDYFGEPYGKIGAIKEINGVKVGFISYNQFLNSEEEKDLALEAIKSIKDKVDVIVVFCHWGNEYQKEQSENQRQFGKEFIDGGADLVIGAHPHVIQPFEEYNGKRIYYSLGNFIFDQYFNEDVKKGMGVIVSINEKTKELSFEEKYFSLKADGQTILLDK